MPTDSAQSPKSIQELPELFHSVADKLPTPMLVHVGGIIQYLNPSCLRLLGASSKADFVGASLLSIVHPFDRLMLMQRVEQLLREQAELAPFEFKLLRQDGSCTWIEFSETLLSQYGETAICMIGQNSAVGQRFDEQKTDRLKETQALYVFSQAVGSANSPEQIYSAALDASIALLKADRVSIRLLGADQGMHFAASRGLSEQYLIGADGHSPWQGECVNPEPIFIQDIQQDVSMVCFHALALAEGLHGCGFVPLVHQDRLIGKFMVYFNSSHVFSPSDEQLAKTIALQVAMAIDREITVRQLRIAATAFDTEEGIIVTDAKNQILRVNQAFSSITGYSSDEVVGKTPAMLRSGWQSGTFYAAMWHEINQQQRWQGDVWNRKKDGTVYLEHLNITAVLNEHHEVVNYVAMFTDITRQKAAQDEIYNLAYYDPLTQLANRKLMLDRLNQSLQSSAKQGKHGAVILIDLDHFKTLNDTQGHAVGDLLLIEVARRLKDCVRDFETVARLGSDEFLLSIESLSEHAEEAALQAKTVAIEIQVALNTPFILQGVKYHSTPSIGIAVYRGHEFSGSELIKHADIAMYQAKLDGRNSVRFFDSSMQITLENRVNLETALRFAIESEQFELHYQIQLDNSRQVTGAEALIRWRHPNKGMVSPAEFIPLAEETGHILLIGRWVIQTACQQLKTWSEQASTRHLRISVNVSARQFAQESFVEQVQELLDQSSIDPTRLKLELTESLMLMDTSRTIEKMHRIKALGVELSMDDFGTGFSSLSQLKKLPLTQLKIDQSFVRDLASDQNDKAIVQAIVSLGTALGMNVIAEGVETSKQHSELIDCGCFHYQGFLFGRPMPIGALNEFLAQSAQAPEILKI